MTATKDHGSIGENVKVHFAGCENVDFAYVMDNKGTAKVNYRQLHDLGIFLAYDYKTRKWKSVKEAQDVKVKTKTKKDNDIPGQYSIFDY